MNFEWDFEGEIFHLSLGHISLRDVVSRVMCWSLVTCKEGHQSLFTKPLLIIFSAKSGLRHDTNYHLFGYIVFISLQRNQE